jgi:hypothetical protein
MITQALSLTFLYIFEGLCLACGFLLVDIIFTVYKINWQGIKDRNWEWQMLIPNLATVKH